MLVDLTQFCDPARLVTAEPMLVDNFAVATDGYCLVSIPTPRGCKFKSVDVVSLEYRDCIVEYMAATKSLTHEVSRTVLLQWCNTERESVPCTDCNGTGTLICVCECGHVHNKKCGDCEGFGKLAANKIQLGTILGCVVNKRRLFPIMSVMSAKVVRVGASRSNTLLALRCGDVRVVLMGNLLRDGDVVPQLRQLRRIRR